MKTYAVQEDMTKESAEKLRIFPPLLARLLYSRGIATAEDAEKFLNPSYDAHTHDPFLMKDMEKAMARILQAIQGNERIAIWSDYDADGIPGAVVLHDFFKKLGYANFENYIPDRRDEGFGLNNGGIEVLAKRGTRLIITIDCGITDAEEVALANELGLDVIITDHHLPPCSHSPLTKGALPSSAGGMSTAPALVDLGTPYRSCTSFASEDGRSRSCEAPSIRFSPFIKGELRDQLPLAFAILNPKQSDCAYPEKMLCGSAVVFKLIQALALKLSTFNFQLATISPIPQGWEKWLLDMVGLATLSDMVSLTGENRVFAYYGLKVLRKSPRVGLSHLCSLLRMNRRELTEDDIGFMITPRINAASRMGAPMDAFRLFATTDEAEAGVLAKHLNKINDERKGLVASLVKEVRKIVHERHLERAPSVVVAGNPSWRPSLLGLVANSLAEDFAKPVFVWGREGSNLLKGSCRSGGSVDLSVLMQEARSVFLDFGGHREAGGFSVALEKVHLLEEELERAYEKVRTSGAGEASGAIVDAKLSLDDISWDTWRQIEKLAPFGVGNPKPLFLFENVEVRRVEQFGKDKNHLKLIFEKETGEKISAIKFFAKPEDFSPRGSTSWKEVEPRGKVNLLAHLERFTFRDFPELRLRIVDIIVT